MMDKCLVGWVALVAVAGCKGDPEGIAFGNESGGGTDNGGEASSTTATVADPTTSGAGPTTGSVDPDTTAGETDDAKFDTPMPDAPRASCAVDGRDGNAPPPCTDSALPDSFEPEVQWSWSGTTELDEVVAAPLVANLTDDNGDGVIDLCDTPDIVVVAFEPFLDQSMIPEQGRLVVLDGATGEEHFVIDHNIYWVSHPALGDIDDDGLPEIIVAAGDTFEQQRLTAFNHDGSLLWEGEPLPELHSRTVGLADIDNDGDVEIVVGTYVFDHEGAVLWQADHEGASGVTHAIADLDGDDDMEIMIDHAAYHHDGSDYYETTPTSPGTFAHPLVANMDDDDDPEVVLIGDGITILEWDGEVAVDWSIGELGRSVPGAIHDVDSDGRPELLTGSGSSYTTFEDDLSVKWTVAVADTSGGGAGAAFDFLGDGQAEAMYADEASLFVFDDSGTALSDTPRTSWTQWEYPVVADIDNDGSAEIVVVSNRGPTYAKDHPPAVQVIRDADDRWIQARRIWNQNSYHVTNVREDGTIPQVEPKHWLGLNTYRTQAQISSGGQVCRPEG